MLTGESPNATFKTNTENDTESDIKEENMDLNIFDKETLTYAINKSLDMKISFRLNNHNNQSTLQ